MFPLQYETIIYRSIHYSANNSLNAPQLTKRIAQFHKTTVIARSSQSGLTIGDNARLSTDRHLSMGVGDLSPPLSLPLPPFLAALTSSHNKAVQFLWLSAYWPFTSGTHWYLVQLELLIQFSTQFVEISSRRCHSISLSTFNLKCIAVCHLHINFSDLYMYFWHEVRKLRKCLMVHKIYEHVLGTTHKFIPLSRPNLEMPKPMITSERAQRAERVLSFLEKSEHSRPGPTRPDPITLFKALYLRNRMSDRQAVFFDEYHLDVKVVWHGYHIASVPVMARGACQTWGTLGDPKNTLPQ